MTIEELVKNPKVMDDEVLFKKIKDAFIELYDKDKDLINNIPANIEIELKDKSGNEGKYYVGERSIVFRFAHYLQNYLYNTDYQKYHLDCEYNRNGIETKKLPDLKYGTIPDLIIHQRGSNDNNLLVMEFKTYWNVEQENDIKKISAFLENNEINSYNYKYGIAALIKRNNVNLKLFEKDNKIFEDDKEY